MSTKSTKSITPAAVEPIGRSWEAECVARNARIAATLDLKDLDDRDRAFLATCQNINRRNRGCYSPFEQFFESLVYAVMVSNWPTPDDVAGYLDEFRDNFNLMQENVSNFVEAYSESARSAEPPAAPESRERRPRKAA